MKKTLAVLGWGMKTLAIYIGIKPLTKCGFDAGGPTEASWQTGAE